jgi:hypothetical protein
MFVPVVSDVVVLAARLDVTVEQPGDDVLAEPGRGGGQRAARGEHHRRKRGGQHEAVQHRGQLLLDELRKGVVAGLQRGQCHCRRLPSARRAT